MTTDPLTHIVMLPVFVLWTERIDLPIINPVKGRTTRWADGLLPFGCLCFLKEKKQLSFKLNEKQDLNGNRRGPQRRN